MKPERIPSEKHGAHERVDRLQQRVAELEQQLAVCQQDVRDERARRIAAEDTLRRRDALFRSFFERHHNPMLVLQEDTIWAVNTAAETLLERSASDLIGERAGFFIAQERTEVEIPGPHRVRMADLLVSDMEWEGERVSLVLLRDMTNYQRMAQELQQTNERLEQRVYERTAELAQNQHS